MASVANCALNLLNNDVKYAQYVKRLRQRIREQGG